MCWSRSIIDPKIWRHPEIDGYNHPKRNVIPLLLVSVRVRHPNKGAGGLRSRGPDFRDMDDMNGLLPLFCAIGAGAGPNRSVYLKPDPPNLRSSSPIRIYSYTRIHCLYSHCRNGRCRQEFEVVCRVYFPSSR
jgi:hypothetical protein